LSTRERHLRREFSYARVSYPVASTAPDKAADADRSPADAVWWLHHHHGALLRLADLAATVMDGRHDRAD
jgi:hypothetical protein